MEKPSKKNDGNTSKQNGENSGSTPKQSGGNTPRPKLTFNWREHFWKLTTLGAVVLAIVFLVQWISLTGALSSLGLSVEEVKAQAEPYVPSERGEPQATRRPMIPGLELDGRVIIVDAGHGGGDPGMTGVSGREEKEVNLEISYKLRDVLESRGAQVIMTRQTDAALGATKEEDFVARENIINNANADMFLCIHCNSYDEPEATGPQTFFVAQGSVGKRLAVHIQDAMNEMLDPVEPRMSLPAAYRLLKSGSQPSCTVECGFMSNPEEEALLQTDEYQYRVVDAIAEGVMRYVEQFG